MESTVGLQRGCQPSRCESLSLERFSSVSAIGFDRVRHGRRQSWPALSCSSVMALSLKSAGLSKITPCHSHFGRPGP